MAEFAMVLLRVFVMVGLFCAYFLPTFFGRRKRDLTGIFVLNLFLGWTAVGWAAALIWAFVGADRQRVRSFPEGEFSRDFRNLRNC